MKTLSNYWNRISLAGSGLVEDDRLKRKVVLSNQISITFFLLCFPMLLVAKYIFGVAELFLFTILIMFSCALAPYLNYKGYYNFTRLAICNVGTLTAGIIPIYLKCIYPDIVGINLYYVPKIALMLITILPLLLIDLREIQAMFITLLGIVFFLFGGDIIEYYLGVGFFEMQPLMGMYYYFNYYVAMLFIFILSALFYLQRNNSAFESEIVELNHALDKRVREKTEKLQNVNQDLEAFNFMVSHEIKTPLIAAQMISESLLTNNKEGLTEKGQNELKVMGNCLNEIQTLINNINDFTKTSKRSFKKKVFSMQKLVDEVIADFEMIGLPEHVSIEVGDLPEVEADYSTMKQVLTNLISNAIKFTRKRGKAVIEIGYSEGAFFVKDNGVGFSPKHAENLFKLHSRFHSRAEYEGSGLGLAIAQRIIKGHNGSIWANSEPENGATFYFSLS